MRNVTCKPNNLIRHCRPNNPLDIACKVANPIIDRTPGVEAQVVVENNSFENVNNLHIFYNEEPAAQIRLNNDNYYANDVTGKRDNGQGSSFVILYEYSLDRRTDVKQIVMTGAALSYWLFAFGLKNRLIHCS